MTSAAKPAGANCANGGSKFTAANNNVTYACDGSGGTGGIGSLDALRGSPCNNGAGTTEITYGSNGSVSLTCGAQTRHALTVTLNSISGGSGTVTSSPVGISCSGTCTATFSAGTNVTLTATPAAGDTFADRGGDCTAPRTGDCTLVMTAAKNATADFGPGVTLTVSMSRVVSCCGAVSPVDPRITCRPNANITRSPPGMNCGPFSGPLPVTQAGDHVHRGIRRGTTVTLTNTATPSPWGDACASATGAACTSRNVKSSW